MCEAAGDPHFNSFDCVKFEYHGECSYTLVKNCGDELNDFDIIGEFHRRHSGKRSVIKKLLIISEQTVRLIKQKFITFLWPSIAKFLSAKFENNAF